MEIQPDDPLSFRNLLTPFYCIFQYICQHPAQINVFHVESSTNDNTVLHDGFITAGTFCKFRKDGIDQSIGCVGDKRKLFGFFSKFLYILSGTCIVLLFKIGGQGIHMMPDLMVYFQNMFVVFCLIPVVFQYALGNPLFFLFAADVSHDTEEYGIHHESKYCKQYKHNMDNYIIGKIYYA